MQPKILPSSAQKSKATHILSGDRFVACKDAGPSHTLQLASRYSSTKCNLQDLGKEDSASSAGHHEEDSLQEADLTTTPRMPLVISSAPSDLSSMQQKPEGRQDPEVDNPAHAKIDPTNIGGQGRSSPGSSKCQGDSESPAEIAKGSQRSLGCKGLFGADIPRVSPRVGPEGKVKDTGIEVHHMPPSAKRPVSLPCILEKDDAEESGPAEELSGSAGERKSLSISDGPIGGDQEIALAEESCRDADLGARIKKAHSWEGALPSKLKLWLKSHHLIILFQQYFTRSTYNGGRGVADCNCIEGDSA